MNLFAKWTAIAHVTLTKHHPTIKLSQTRELLSTWVGHKTFASLKIHDLQIINDRRALYIIVNDDDVFIRAKRLGVELSFDHWLSVRQKLSPSGISGGFWLVWMKSMISAACNIFEYNDHPEKFRISRQIGTHDGYRSTVVARPREVEDYPLELIVDVNSELLTFNQNESVFFPSSWSGIV